MSFELFATESSKAAKLILNELTYAKGLQNVSLALQDHFKQYPKGIVYMYRRTSATDGTPDIRAQEQHANMINKMWVKIRKVTGLNKRMRGENKLVSGTLDTGERFKVTTDLIYRHKCYECSSLMELVQNAPAGSVIFATIPTRFGRYDFEKHGNNPSHRMYIRTKLFELVLARAQEKHIKFMFIFDVDRYNVSKCKNMNQEDHITVCDAQNIKIILSVWGKKFEWKNAID